MNGIRITNWLACGCALCMAAGLSRAQSPDPFADLLGPGAAPEPAVESPAPPAEGDDLGFGSPTPLRELPANPEDVTPEQRMGEAEALSLQEIVRRQADEKAADDAISAARQAMINGQWAIAVAKFDEALSKLKDIPRHQARIQESNRLKSEAYVEMARALYDRRREGGSLEQASEFLAKAVEAWAENPKPAQLSAEIEKYRERVRLHKEDRPIAEEPEYRAARQNVADLMLRGRQELEIGDYDKAEKTFESILAFDRYNKEALRFMERVAEKRWEARQVERRASVMNQMAEGEARWLRPLRVDQRGASTAITPTSEGPVERETSDLEAKLSRIRIKEIRFQGAEINDVISFLTQASRENDPDGIGINIIFMDPNAGGAGAVAAPAAPVAADPFGFGAPAAAAPPALGGGVGTVAPIHLELRNVTLLDALKLVTQISGLYYRVERDVVIIEREGTGRFITRFYPVDPARWTAVTGSIRPSGGGLAAANADPFGAAQDPFGGGAAAPAAAGPDMKEIFTRFGMKFPQGAEIAYEPLISQLVVTLTPNQFPQFEEILEKINVAPRQVQIEARFVEVLQRDLEQLGFEWILNDDAEVLVQGGPGPVGAKPRIQVDKMSTGFTGGLRFFNFDAVSNATAPVPRSPTGNNNFLGDILSMRGVLTNPELQLVVQALDQKGNSDLLSAPRVTTINGVNAIIEVVNEIIYPTEFDVTENDIEVQGAVGGGDGENPNQPVFIPPTVIPGGFETRNVGVILNVTPTVNADNYTINLVMLPEIAELVDWIQYGTQVPIGDQVFTVNMPQPVFASRNITTSMIVWDGHTVVMGGLIREDLVTFKDKVPLLGDIPLLGRLFRSEGRKSEKRNLLIFVTATLVDPAGNPSNAQSRQELIQSNVITPRGGAVASP